jgi:hypothetical protein
VTTLKSDDNVGKIITEGAKEVLKEVKKSAPEATQVQVGTFLVSIDCLVHIII